MGADRHPVRDGDAERSIGYAQFCERLQKDPEFAKWFRSLVESVKGTPDGGRAERRLVALQHGLIDLLDFLDPNFGRFSEHRRRRTDFDRAPAGRQSHD